MARLAAPDILAELRRLGGRLIWREGDRLVLEGPPGAIPPELAAALKRNKDELAETLRAEADESFYNIMARHIPRGGRTKARECADGECEAKGRRLWGKGDW